MKWPTEEKNNFVQRSIFKEGYELYKKAMGNAWIHDNTEGKMRFASTIKQAMIFLGKFDPKNSNCTNVTTILKRGGLFKEGSSGTIRYSEGGYGTPVKIKALKGKDLLWTWKEAGEAGTVMSFKSTFISK